MWRQRGIQHLPEVRHCVALPPVLGLGGVPPHVGAGPGPDILVVVLEAAGPGRGVGHALGVSS